MSEGEEREKLFESYFSDDNTMSYVLAGRSMGGFNGRIVPYEVREKYHERFWEKAENVLKTKSREMAKVSYCFVNNEIGYLARAYAEV